jgi:hypothetical protein
VKRIVRLLCCIVLFTAALHASPISVGGIGFQEFIPASGGLPGINTIFVANLTGPFAFPPDFPVEDPLIFLDSSLEVFEGETAWAFFSLGGIGPGFLEDPDGNPVVLLPGDRAFSRARFRASLAGGASLDVWLLPSVGDSLAPGDFALIAYTVTATGIPEPSTLVLLAVGALVFAFAPKRGALLAVLVCGSRTLEAQSAITLAAATSPAAGQPSITTMTITGSGFPSGAIAVADLRLTLQPVSSGPQYMATATAITTLLGSSRSVTFQFTGPNVSSPAAYRLHLEGKTIAGQTFAATNTAALTVNPPPAVTPSPSLAKTGRQVQVALTGQYTNFLAGVTRAQFGPGVGVGGAAPGEFGPVTVASATAATAQITIAPNAPLGSRSVTVATGAQQASFAFTAENLPPSVNAGPDLTITLPAVAALNGSVADDGAPGPAPTSAWSKVSGPGTVSFSAPNAPVTNAAFSLPGVYVLRLTASDTILSAFDDVTVNVLQPANQPPAFTSSPVTSAIHLQPYSYQALAIDPNQDPVTYSLTQAPLGMTIHAQSGLVSWTPPGTGALPVTIQASDGKGGVATQSFNVQVSPMPNSPPVLSAIPNFTIPFGEKLGVVLAANDPNPKDLLTFSLPMAPAGASLQPSPVVRWTPAANQIGAHAFTARVQDPGGLFDSKSFQVSVTNANVPPVLGDLPDATIPAGVLFTRNLSATDLNPGNNLTFSLRSGPAGMTLANGNQLRWTPGANQLGRHLIQVQVADSAGAADVGQFALTVVPPPANFPPVARNDRYALRRNQTLNVASPGVLANDSDPDGNALNARLITAPAKGALNLAASGAFTYTPFPPAANSLEPVLKFGFSGAAGLATARSSVAVADLDRDGVAEIIIHCAGAFNFRRLYAINGATGAILWERDTYQPAAIPSLAVELETDIAVGDLDGDGFPEIVAVNSSGVQPNVAIRRQLVAFTHTGAIKWFSPDIQDGVNVLATSGMIRPVIANISGDAKPEIVVAHGGRTPATPAGTTQEDLVTAFNSQGQILWTARGPGRSDLSPVKGNLVIHDIDLDGRPEILSANDVFSANGVHLWSAGSATGPAVQDTAVMNLDGDAFGEVLILDVFGNLSAYEHTGALKWGPVMVPASDATGLGLITIGDTDGDGKSEILIPRDANLCIYGTNGVLQRTIPLATNTGFGGTATIFDLNADGRPEILYISGRGPFDQGFTLGALHIIDGPTGSFLHSVLASRHTGGILDKGFVVADVDGDGAAEIVTPGWSDTIQVRVFEAKFGHWAPVRPVYHQSSYFVTNVNKDASIPAQPSPNWLSPGMNDFRVNRAEPTQVESVQDVFTYVANDGALDSNVASVTLDILPPNTAPRILSVPSAAAATGVEYVYAAQAFDPDPGDTLTFTLLLGPAGMTLSSATGLLRWQPVAGSHLVALRVTDSQGQTDHQSFTLNVGAPVQTPALVGLSQNAAQAALVAAGFSAGVTTLAPSASVAVGLVVSQEPAAGAPIAPGGSVSFVVSSGPAPVPVPYVVGLGESTAASLLLQSGFSASVTRSFSNTIPQGLVISQSPAGNTIQIPGPVVIVVSAGTGLRLSLQKSVTPAGTTLPFTLLATDLNGNTIAPPAVQYTINAALTPSFGVPPSVNGGSINVPASTRGAFRLTATDPLTNRQASAEFSVVYPRVPGKQAMADAIGSMSQAMEDIDGLARQGRAALAGNNVTQVNSILQQMVTRWRQVDLAAVRLATPLSVENGFPATPQMAAGLGLSPTPDDIFLLEILKDANADLKAWTAGLRAPNTSLQQLRTLAQNFGARAARMRGLRPSEWGVLQAQPLYTMIISRRMPDLYDAVFDEVGLAASIPVNHKGFARFSTLAELVTSMAMEYIVEELAKPFTEIYTNAKQFTVDVLLQAAWGGAVVAAAQHIRAAIQGQDLAAVVSGASLSFRVFEAPWSFLEGDVDGENPELNTVVLVGPEILAPLSPLLDKIKGAYKYKQILDPNANDGKYKNFDEIWEDLKSFKQALEDLANSAQNLVDTVKGSFQIPQEGARGCVFSNAPACSQLHYPDGLRSVYKYAPPPGFASFTGLPLPIIFMVYNHTTGQMSFDTPPFFPTPP